MAAEGIKIAVEQIHECLAMKGIAGIHLMAIEWEDHVPRDRRGRRPLPAQGGSGIKTTTLDTFKPGPGGSGFFYWGAIDKDAGRAYSDYSNLTKSFNR